MPKRFVVIDHVGTIICQEITLIGMFDTWKEAAKTLESNGFELEDDGYVKVFVDRNSKKLHWAAILDRQHDIIPKWVPLEIEEP